MTIVPIVIEKLAFSPKTWIQEVSGARLRNATRMKDTAVHKLNKSKEYVGMLKSKYEASDAVDRGVFGEAIDREIQKNPNASEYIKKALYGKGKKIANDPKIGLEGMIEFNFKDQAFQEAKRRQQVKQNLKELSRKLIKGRKEALENANKEMLEAAARQPKARREALYGASGLAIGGTGIAIASRNNNKGKK